MTTTDESSTSEFRDDYILQQVDAAWLTQQVKPKQFIHIDQSRHQCEGWLTSAHGRHPHGAPRAIDEAIGMELPGSDPNDNVIFTIDDDVCTRCAFVSIGLHRRHHPRQDRDPAAAATPTRHEHPATTACVSATPTPEPHGHGLMVDDEVKKPPSADKTR